MSSLEHESQNYCNSVDCLDSRISLIVYFDEYLKMRGGQRLLYHMQYVKLLTGSLILDSKYIHSYCVLTVLLL